MTDERNRYTDFSEREKTALREQLRSFMHANPLRAPFGLRALDFFEETIYSPRLQFAGATFGLLLLAGTGTAFAAENSLPGEPLYGVKVNVEEPIAGAFATSPQEQANWSAQLAARRLSEAETLAVQNKLTPSAATTIAGGLNEAAGNFDASVAQLATSSANAATVATLASSMEATLAANSQVMTEIGNAIPAAAKTLEPIISTTQERALSLNTARAQYDAAVAEGNVAQVQGAAEAEMNSAQGQISAVAQNNDSAAASSSVAKQTEAAEADIQSGQQNLAQGNYVAALETFQSAAVEAKTAQLNMSIGGQFSETGTTTPQATTSPSESSQAATSSAATTTDATTSASSSTSSDHHE